MKHLSLLLVLVLVIGCTQPIGTQPIGTQPRGCGQRALLDYSNATNSQVSVHEINTLLPNHFTSMYELKQTAEQLGFRCKPVLFSKLDEFKEYTGYAVILTEGNRESPIGHYILVQVEDNKIYHVLSPKEKTPFKIKNWVGVALLLST